MKAFSFRSEAQHITLIHLVFGEKKEVEREKYFITRVCALLYGRNKPINYSVSCKCFFTQCVRKIFSFLFFSIRISQWKIYPVPIFPLYVNAPLRDYHHFYLHVFVHPCLSYSQPTNKLSKAIMQQTIPYLVREDKISKRKPS